MQPLKMIGRKLINVKEDLSHISALPIGDPCGFGVVHKGKFHKRHKDGDELIDCAIKYIKSKGNFNEDFELFHRELQTQNLIKHPSLLPLLGFSLPFCGVGKLTLVTPLMKNGSLRTILDNEKLALAPYEWNDIKRIITIIGTAAGLCRMHQENLVHRDIKPANILFDENFYPKICDFGLSKIFEEGLDEMLQRTNCGTESYMAPELFFGDKKYNSKVDVFSYGLVLYEIFTTETFSQRLKKERKTYVGALSSGYRPDLSKDERFSPFFANLINDCWATNPESRPSFNMIISLLLKAYEDEELISRDTDIDDYIIDTVECLGFDVEFCKKA